MKAQVRLHVIEDEMFFLAMLGTETTLGISNKRGLISAARPNVHGKYEVKEGLVRKD